MMDSMASLSAPCPNCNNPVIWEDNPGPVYCQNCNWSFELKDHLCPVCNTYHYTGETICIDCGTPLNRICHKCQTVNWSGNESCSSCRSSLHLLGVVSEYHGKSTEMRLNRQMSEAGTLKELEGITSDRRMADFHALEEERLSKIRFDEENRRRQERRMLQFTAIAVILFSLSLITYALINLL